MSAPTTKDVAIRPLLIFPDTIWLHIFSHLDGLDLITVLEVGHFQLSRVARDVTLWRQVRVSPPGETARRRPLAKAELRRLLPFLGVQTNAIRIRVQRDRAEKRKTRKNNSFFSTAFLQSVSLRCPNLQTLALENASFDALENPFLALPRSVKSLSLKGSRLENLPYQRSRINSPLLHLQKRMTVLKEIDLTETDDWLNKCDVAAAKELKTLETIVLSEVRVLTRLSRTPRRSRRWPEKELDLDGFVI